MNINQLSKIENITKEYLRHTKDSQHHFDHILRVKQNALKIVKLLGVEEKVDLNIIQASCLLHDITYSTNNSYPLFLVYLFEGFLSKNIVINILKSLNISSKEIFTISNAISKHSKSFPFKKLNKNSDLYTKILQDADTIDFFNEKRVKNFKDSSILTSRASSIINKITDYGKDNIHKYLNFPELSLYFFQPNVFSHTKFWGGTKNDTLLCIHGYADNSSLFTPLAKLIKHRYKIVSLDLPMTYSKKYFKVTELVNYLENFRKKLGLKKFNLVGFSLGGLIALEYSLKYPKNVSKLFVLNSFPCLLNSKRLRIIYKLLKPFLLLPTCLYLCSRISTCNLIRKFTSNLVLTNKQKSIMKRYYKSIFGTLLTNLTYCKSKEFNKLLIPKTLVLFKDDKILKWRHYKNSAKSLNGKLIVFDNGGHASGSIYWQNIAQLF